MDEQNVRNMDIFWLAIWSVCMLCDALPCFPHGRGTAQNTKEFHRRQSRHKSEKIIIKKNEKERRNATNTTCWLVTTTTCRRQANTVRTIKRFCIYCSNWQIQTIAIFNFFVSFPFVVISFGCVVPGDPWRIALTFGKSTMVDCVVSDERRRLQVTESCVLFAKNLLSKQTLSRKWRRKKRKNNTKFSSFPHWRLE